MEISAATGHIRPTSHPGHGTDAATAMSRGAADLAAAQGCPLE